MQTCTFIGTQASCVSQLCEVLPRFRGLLQHLTLEHPTSGWAALQQPYYSGLTGLRLIFDHGQPAGLDVHLSALLPRLRLLHLLCCCAPTAEVAHVLSQLAVAEDVSVAGSWDLDGGTVAALAHLGSSLRSINAKGIAKVPSDVLLLVLCPV